MIACTPIRELTLRANGGPGFLSAASGMVRRGRFFYVVADDELGIARFEVAGEAPGERLRLLPGTLPDDHAARKRAKPDFESLLLLPDGQMLALPSGSRPNRVLGVRIAVDDEGRAMGAPLTIDLTALYAPLLARFSSLNIEGAVVVGDQLRLFQRGNKGGSPNACIRFPLDALLKGAPPLPISIDILQLGAIDGVPLAFTDVCALSDGRMVFCAAAEDTVDAYDDGAYRGAAIGIIDVDGTLARVERLDCAAKVEGIHAEQLAGEIELLLVTDADDRKIPAQLLSARVPE